MYSTRVNLYAIHAILLSSNFIKWCLVLSFSLHLIDNIPWCCHDVYCFQHMWIGVKIIQYFDSEDFFCFLAMHSVGFPNSLLYASTPFFVELYLPGCASELWLVNR
jgi:hypothetical protein